jgi:tetratricopeptide (TPR) repeat protein
VRELLRTAHYSDDDSVKRASLDKAQQLAAKAIELDPNYADAYGYLGVLYMRRGQYGWGEAWFDSADALAKSLMTRGPRERGHAHWIQGDLAWRLRRWTEGADHLEKAAGLLRDEVELQSQAALAHYLLGNFDKSFVFWRRGAALDPQRPDPCRAGSYFHLDLLDEAEACSRRLLEIDYNDSWGFRVLVKTYIAQGRDLEAQQLLQRTPPLLFDRSLYLSNLAGDVALIMGDHGRAREYYERGLARNRNGISSGVWVARTSLAHILWKAGERDSARVLLEESEAYDWDRLEKRPMRWGWYYDLAAVHAIRGDKEKAHRYLRAAFDAGWHWFRLGLRDPRLKSIRADDRFRLLMAEVEDSVAAMRSRVPKDLLASGLADKE